MHSDKGVAAMVLRKHGAGIECQTENGRMSLEQDIRYKGLNRWIVPLALMPWIGVRTDISIWPTVEASRTDTRQKIRREVIAEPITLLDACPELVASRIE